MDQLTPGDLYERVVALGLCERATYRSWPLHHKDDGWYVLGLNNVLDSEAEDLAAARVLRALLKDGNVLMQYRDLTTIKWSTFVWDMHINEARHAAFASPTFLESLCLCLLRAKGHVESGKE